MRDSDGDPWCNAGAGVEIERIDRNGDGAENIHPCQTHKTQVAVGVEVAVCRENGLEI